MSATVPLNKATADRWRNAEKERNRICDRVDMVGNWREVDAGRLSGGADADIRPRLVLGADCGRLAAQEKNVK
jgi:hypothetical protein